MRKIWNLCNVFVIFFSLQKTYTLTTTVSTVYLAFVPLKWRQCFVWSIYKRKYILWKADSKIYSLLLPLFFCFVCFCNHFLSHLSSLLNLLFRYSFPNFLCDMTIFPSVLPPCRMKTLHLYDMNSNFPRRAACIGLEG